MLSDRQIAAAYAEGHVTIVPPPTTRKMQPASLDVHLGADILVLDADGAPLDPKISTSPRFKPATLPEEGLTLYAGQLWLATTVERFRFGKDLVGQLEGKSSLGRLGLQVHSTAGFIDPGFIGQITLELSCAHHLGIVLYPGMPIGQLAFTSIDGVARPYRGKYQEQAGPTVSRYELNWDGQAWT